MLQTYPSTYLLNSFTSTYFISKYINHCLLSKASTETKKLDRKPFRSSFRSSRKKRLKNTPVKTAVYSCSLFFAKCAADSQVRALKTPSLHLLPVFSISYGWKRISCIFFHFFPENFGLKTRVDYCCSLFLPFCAADCEEGGLQEIGWWKEEWSDWSIYLGHVTWLCEVDGGVC